jgi:hypothetical protein
VKTLKLKCQYPTITCTWLETHYVYTSPIHNAFGVGEWLEVMTFSKLGA